MNDAPRETGELWVIHVESIGHRSEAKAALSGLAAHRRSNQPHTHVGELAAEPTIYLVRVCDTEGDIHKVLRELCEEIFVEQLAAGSEMKRPGCKAAVSTCSAFGLISNTIRLLVDLALHKKL